eukprot:m51a1_g9762 hypothetical protein (272) ;mRNA; r:1624684-1625585
MAAPGTHPAIPPSDTPAPRRARVSVGDLESLPCAQQFLDCPLAFLPPSRPEREIDEELPCGHEGARAATAGIRNGRQENSGSPDDGHWDTITAAGGAGHTQRLQQQQQQQQQEAEDAGRTCPWLAEGSAYMSTCSSAATAVVHSQGSSMSLLDELEADRLSLDAPASCDDDCVLFPDHDDRCDDDEDDYNGEQCGRYERAAATGARGLRDCCCDYDAEGEDEERAGKKVLFEHLEEEDDDMGDAKDSLVESLEHGDSPACLGLNSNHRPLI